MKAFYTKKRRGEIHSIHIETEKKRNQITTEDNTERVSLLLIDGSVGGFSIGVNLIDRRRSAVIN